MLSYWEIGDGKSHFSWVTDLCEHANVFHLNAGGTDPVEDRKRNVQ